MADEKFDNIQVLRAIAATSVVVVHAAGTSVQYASGPSYAIYLVHVFLVAIVGKVSRTLVPSLNADILAAVVVIVSLLAGLIRSSG